MGSDNSNLTNLPQLTLLFVGRERVVHALDSALIEPHTCLVSLQGIAGLGKTQCIQYWLNNQQCRNARPTQLKVFGWSWNTQAARDWSSEKHISGFLLSALRWFGDEKPELGTSFDRVSRLITLLRESPAILILDGLETLQQPFGIDAGRIRCPLLKILVRELSTLNKGLCVVTSRFPIADIGHLRRSSVREVELPPLSERDGAKLLRKLGASGTAEQLANMSRELKGHPDSLISLGIKARKQMAGCLQRQVEVFSLFKSDLHMEAYRRLLGHRPESDVLKILSLFDGPASESTITVLFNDPLLNSELTGLKHCQSTIERKRNLSTLSRMYLVQNFPSQKLTEIHPMVKRYFRNQFQREQPHVWSYARDIATRASTQSMI